MRTETIVLAIILNIVYHELRAYAQAQGVPTATAFLVFIVRKRVEIYKDNRRRKRKWRA